MDAILNLDKPPNLSSAAAVGTVKRLLPRGTKVGHAGTLDPFATGVLLVLIGKATKRCESMMNQPKAYRATVKLGATTVTDDRTEPELPNDWAGEPPTRYAVESLLPEFVGDIIQRPPAFSALKVGGKRAYQLARKGVAPPLSSRTVKVYELSIVDYQWPLLSIDVRSGRGFYVRALARDLGERLGCGGYLTELRRTAVGEYRVDESATLATLTAETLHSLKHRLVSDTKN